MDISSALSSVVAGLDLWDKNDDLNATAMVIRALIVFVATLTFLRIAGSAILWSGERL
ncbi:hypothetical protein MKD49_12290 [Herbaspirillum sp. WGmk3]|uniref:hypothetical protein n=1 Tax=Herbaspirillum sp. WGmk3 TaxID=2919925 RepID=UPI00209022E0|nr:hypothetical protein [Herbaspirillum sp. WGmk3]MCO4857259.1 hypothetical protein [Herbaspirillum sp. WGmk3]